MNADDRKEAESIAHWVKGMLWPFDLYEDYDLAGPDKKKVAHDRMMEIVRALNRQLGPIVVSPG